MDRNYRGMGPETDDIDHPAGQNESLMIICAEELQEVQSATFMLRLLKL